MGWTHRPSSVSFGLYSVTPAPARLCFSNQARRYSCVRRKFDGVLLVPNSALRFKPADPAEKKEADGFKGGPGLMGPPGGQPAKGRKRDGQSGTVYVLAGGDIKPVSVQLGITDNRNTEVVGGELKEGDRVVTGENSNGDKKPSSVGMRMF